jgi:rubrerythrin
MTIRQVLEMAIDGEAQAIEFYNNLAAQAENPAMAELYEQLAREEFKHKCRLELEMLKEGVVVQRLGHFDEVEPPEYAEELALPPDAEYKQLVEMGVKKERRAFRLYARLAGIVSDKGARETLFELAEEEAHHLAQFQAESARLAEKGQ